MERSRGSLILVKVARLIGIVCLVTFPLAASAAERSLSELQKTYSVEDAKARSFIHRIISGDLEGAKLLVAEKSRLQATLDENLRGTSEMLNAGTLITWQLVGVTTQASPEAPTAIVRVRLTYEIHLTTGWFLGTVGVSTDTTEKLVSGMQFSRMEDLLKRTNRFAPMQHGALGVGFMVAMFLVLALMLTAATICLRSSIPNKWAWLLFTLIGTSRLELDWGSGAMKIVYVNIQLLGIAVRKQGDLAPFILAVSAPIGAVLFLFANWQHRKAQSAAEASSVTGQE